MFEKIYARVLICIGIIALITTAFVGYYTFVGLPDNHQNADALTGLFILLLVIGIIFILFGAAIIHDKKKELQASKRLS